MFSRSLKNVLGFSVIAAGLFGFVLSCDNPFSNNLGSKVDIEPPTITVETPVAGTYVQNVARFVGSAEAYRELDSKDPVKVRILNPIEDQPPLLDWTTAGITLEGSSDKKKTWSYDLDTVNFYAEGQGLEDGVLKIQFQVKDSSATSKPVETVELVYIIKNGPSIMKMTAPDQNKLDTDAQVQTLASDSELRGNVIDRRGIKPGYPQIKFWPEEMPEPDGNDPDWGWAILFLSGTDDPDTNGGVYVDRSTLPVVRSANFVFRLSEYTIDPVTRHVKYDLSNGDYKALDSGLYRFRIVTSESYFYTLNEAQADNSIVYLHPRDFKPEFGEVEPLITYLPNIDETYDEPLKSGPSYPLQLVSSGGDPTVELDNSDIERAVLEITPNIYINESTSKKIVTESARRDFRLRVAASHPDLIDKAILEWEHIGSTYRSGFLPWDNTFDDSRLTSLGYVNSADRAESGHKGAWANPANQTEGKYFQFSADTASLKDDDGNLVFTSSTEPYTLIVTVSSTSDRQTIQKYTLYLDGDGPSVTIRSVRGAAQDPSADGELVSGGLINAAPYLINGNIQVSVDRTANMGIKQGADGYPLVKWIIEDDKAGYLTDSDTVYSKIMAFRKAPAAEGLDFFNEIGETLTSGWVQLPDPAGTFEADRNHNFKLNTRAWDGKELWLYVIAQDGIENLGFSLQKLKVDESTDIPVLSAPGLRSNTELVGGLQIDSKDKLYVSLNASNDASREKVNVLDSTQGINLSLSDDDAIGKISITLKDLNDLSETNTPKDIVLNISANSREWNGVLTQELMARALYGNNTTLRNLEDGVYELYIRIDDDEKAKVSIDRDPPEEGDIPVSVGTEKRFYFAVQSLPPEVTIDSPIENSMQNTTPVWINGKITSRLKIQKADITYTPRLSSGGWNQTQTDALRLYSDAAFTRVIDSNNWLVDANLNLDKGVYTYYWRTTATVPFNPNGLFSGARPEQITDTRRFNIRAWDGMCILGTAARTVMVDSTPPAVEMTEFNFGRIPYDVVNGKVPVFISVADSQSGIRTEKIVTGGTGEEGEEGEGEQSEAVCIKWWVSQSAPNWTTPFGGAGGQFSVDDDQGGGIYRIVINTTTLSDGGSYTLYVMAEDNALNQARTQLHTFRVDQNTDLPELKEISPKDNEPVRSGTTTVTGRASDDDGFDSAKSSYYVEIRWGDDCDKGVNEGWTQIEDVTLDSGSGELEFSFSNPYFNSEGNKRYQIRLWDGDGFKQDEDGYVADYPLRKNPDGVRTLEAASKIFGPYTYSKETQPPIIYFAKYDPDMSHPPLDRDGERPTYNSKQTLIAGLNGATGSDFSESTHTFIRETNIAEIRIYFTVSPISQDDKTIINPASDGTGRHYLNLRATWPTITDPADPSYDTPQNKWARFFDAFDALDTGLQSITIEASDTVGNIMVPAVWTFYKDDEGPEISFNNIDIKAIDNEDYTQTIFGEEGKVYITGQLNDDYSAIGASFDYQFDSSGWHTLGIVAGGGTLSGKSATWRVLIPGKFDNTPDSNNITFPDGKHTFSIRAKDSLDNSRDISNVPFVVDRKNPAMNVETENLKVIGSLNGVTHNDPIIDESKRVFSSATAASGNATPVFTLSGIVYEHNLDGLSVNIRNQSTVVTSDALPATLSDINGNAVAWKNDTPVDTWFGNGTSDDTNGVNTVGSNLRVRRATTQDLIDFLGANHGLPNENYRYVWEFDIRQDDFYKLKNVPGFTGEDISRYISVTAVDLAGYKSETLNWQFKLDTSPPVIKFENLTDNTQAPNTSVVNKLEEATPILQVSVTDTTNIQKIDYKIEKYTHGPGTTAWGDETDGSSNANWTVMTTGNSGDDNGWRPYEFTSNRVVNLRINDTGAIDEDGYYRVTIRAADGSLSSTHAGNVAYSGAPAVAPATDGTPVTFYVNRKDPVIKWVDTKSHYKWDTNANGGKIIFTVTAEDANTIDATPANLTGKLLIGSTSNTVPGVTVNVTATDADTDSATLTVTVTRDATNITNGYYTLELTVSDKGDRKALDGHTLLFYLDNDPPDIKVNSLNAVDTAALTEAIVGRVQLTGNFKKDPNASQIVRVAYSVAATVPAVTITTDQNGNVSPGAGWETGLLTNGADPAINLMEIDSGIEKASTLNASILIYNTRNLTGFGGWGTGQTVPNSSPYTFGTWDDDNDPLTPNVPYNIPSGEIVHQLTIHLLAIDEAGNYKIESFKYWVYPAGDIPTVGAMTTPKEPKPGEELDRLNGTITISGKASDNYRVHRVWFRVLKYDNGVNGSQSLVTLQDFPQWNSDGTAKPNLYQGAGTSLTPNNGTSSDGWYEANAGGIAGEGPRRNVTWTAQINANGELDPPDGTKEHKITIEIVAEDTMVNTRLNDPPEHADEGLKSNIESIQAIIVKGAPKFTDEKVKNAASDEAIIDDPTNNGWADIITTNVAGRASYKVTVTNEIGVSTIRWTNPALTGITTNTNLLDIPESAGTNNWDAQIANINTTGIAIKARPKDPISGSSINLSAGDYLIWKPFGTIPSQLSSLVTGGTNVRNTMFTLTSTQSSVNLDGAELLIKTAEGVFEWLVTVDIDSTVLAGGTYADKAEHYNVELTAADNTRPVPIQGPFTARIPIDNQAPTGNYTINRRPAGSSAMIGGEAGDTGTVSGLVKVVLWLTNKSGAGVAWNENQNGTGTGTWVPQPDQPETGNKTLILNSAGAKVPIQLPDETNFNSAIVIDESNPTATATKRKMSFSQGGMGKIWWVEFNSTWVTSGPIYLNYVVYDQAGNTRYYRERLVIMNNAPMIGSINLATDIRGDSGDGTNGPQSLEALLGGTGNLKAETGNTTLANHTTGPFFTIRGDNTTNKNSRGITDDIPMVTSSATYESGTGIIKPVMDFRVRHDLLAFRVNALAAPYSGKTRNFRFEYVSSAHPVTGDALANIKAGAVYIIDSRGSTNWGAVGAPEGTWTRGFTFLATSDGRDENNVPLIGGTGIAYELNGTYYAYNNTSKVWERDNTKIPNDLKLDDASYTSGDSATALSAEFVYKKAAFGNTTGTTDGVTVRQKIADTSVVSSVTYPPASGDPSQNHALFIVKIFDGDEDDQFADFGLVAIRVNNNDRSIPSSRLYDLNPLTEGQENRQTQQQSLAPMVIDNNRNRVRGGLWNTDESATTIVKSGHIEPRKTTSLTGPQMGGAYPNEGTIYHPEAVRDSYFATDTVSGRVILRGYAEDDQRINRIDLVIGDADPVTILEKPSANNAVFSGTPGEYKPATTGLLMIHEEEGKTIDTINSIKNYRVYYTDDLNLYRHRVEWAYIWDTETIPGDANVVGNINVRAVVYNNNSANPSLTATEKVSVETDFNPNDPLAPPPNNDTQAAAATPPSYNRIPINIRPYITGFLRNKDAFAHDTRSRQGRYMFAREETIVVTGFNLRNGTGNTVISLPSAPNLSTRAFATDTEKNNYVVNEAHRNLPYNNPTITTRYRILGTGTNTTNTIPTTATTGNGLITLTVNSQPAVNTGSERPDVTNSRPVIQPWNVEYDPGLKFDTELWDDFTLVHIWKSDDTPLAANTPDQGSFPTRNTNYIVQYPAMTVNPQNGTLYVSQSEGGSGQVNNTGAIIVTNNNAQTAPDSYISQFVDPIITSDIYYSSEYWSAFSIIGRAGNAEYWNALGGLYVKGPDGGGNSNLPYNSTNHYLVEKTWYNVSVNNTVKNPPAGVTGVTSGGGKSPPTTDQFLNPHIITSIDTSNNREHIHVSYYDTDTKSIKYRYNLRGTLDNGNGASTDTWPANINGSATPPVTTAMWTNLDGGVDYEDYMGGNDATYVNGNIKILATGSGDANDTGTALNITAGARIYGYNNGVNRDTANAGEHNAIAVTSQGFPVIAYYDADNRKLKLAISNRVAPILGTSWVVEDVIPSGAIKDYTGQYVSIAIDTRATVPGTTPGSTIANPNLNTVHIAALNSQNKQVVYIKRKINYSATTPPVPSLDTIASNVVVQVVDNVGNVGKWCNISLDTNGNPWIAYKDDDYNLSRDGVKMAYRDTTRFYKGQTGNYPGQDTDLHGNDISGWEAMHVPTQFRVQDARIGMERYPTIRYPHTAGTNNGRPNGSLSSFAAVGYLSLDLYRVAYYVE